MIDQAELKHWISKLEYEGSSWPNYEKLAALYTIQDHQGGGTAPAPTMAYSSAPSPVEVISNYGDSDFLQAVRGKDTQAVLSIMDELMDTLRVVNERIYNSVMRKVESTG